MNTTLTTRWPPVPLGEVATLQRGYDLPTKSRRQGEVPIFAANGPVGTHDEVKVEGPGVVTGRSGTIGKVHYVEGGYWPLNTSLYVKDFHGNHRKFVFYLLRNMQLQRYCEGTGVPTLNRNNVHGVEIPLPPLSEQKRIADILDKAAAIRRKRRKRQLVLTEAEIVPRVVFKEMFGDTTKNDRDWEVCRVDQAGHVQLGRQRAPKYQTGLHTHKYLRVANVYEDRPNLSDVLSMDFDKRDFERYLLKDGDILLNEGQSTELVGRPAIWRSELKDCCFQNTLVRFRVNEELTDEEYALGVFLDFLRRSAFASVSSKTSSVAHLGAARFAAMSFPLPPLSLQRQYGEFRRESRKLVSKYASACAEADDLFSSLVKCAFNGEL
jgi:type I restriction enzyme S subunit